MDDSSRAEEPFLFLKIGLDLIVGILNEDALVVGDLVGKFTIEINGANCLAGLDNALFDARGVIILSKSRGTMDHTCTSV